MMVIKSKLLIGLTILSVCSILMYTSNRILFLLEMLIATALGAFWATKKVFEADEFYLHSSSMSDKRENEPNYYHTITGNESLDVPINQIINFILDEYFYKTWKGLILEENLETDRTTFEIRQSVVYVLRNIYDITSRKDWVAYLTGRFIDILAFHIRLYRQSSESASLSGSQSLTDAFFALEDEHSNEQGSMCSFKNICCDPNIESAYLRDVSDVLLYLLMRPCDFDCIGLRLLVRELFIKFAFVPMIDQVCSPEFINQNIVQFFGSPSLSENTSLDDSFMWVIRKGNCTENELNALLKVIYRQIDELRATNMKSRIECIRNILRCVETSLKKVQEKKRLPVVFSRRSSKLDKCNIDIPLQYVLESNVGLDYFMTFMQSKSSQHYVICYLNMEALKDTLANSESINETEIRAAFKEIYQNYFDKNNSKRPIEIDFEALEPDELTMEDIEHIVKAQIKNLRDILKGDVFYEQFKRTHLYSKLLDELDILSVNENKSKNDLIMRLVVRLGKAEVIGGIVYYTIEVSRSNAQWSIKRRFSDFCDLNELIKKKYAELSTQITFPSNRRLINNTTNTFIYKRQILLTRYLQDLCKDQRLHDYHGLELDMLHFLRPGNDVLPSPIDPLPKRFRTSFTSMLDKMPSLIKRLGRISADKPDYGMSLSLDPEILNSRANNSQKCVTPVRVVLILIDELFDLGKRSITLRNQLTGLIKQLIQKFAGASYSRTIEQMIEKRLYGSGLSGFFYSLRDSLLRKRAVDCNFDRGNQYLSSIMSKTRLVCLASAEIRAIIGNNTSRNGFLMFHELLQNPVLNRRLFHAVLEDTLKYLFPPNDAFKVLRKAYGRI